MKLEINIDGTDFDSVPVSIRTDGNIELDDAAYSLHAKYGEHGYIECINAILNELNLTPFGESAQFDFYGERVTAIVI